MLLDIDFDYFVKETVFHDFGYHESKFFMESMWDIRFVTAYGNPLNGSRDLTKEFILDDDGLKDVLDFIKNCRKIKSWAISDSHLFAYEYIKNGQIHSILDGIVHIDRHNDYNIVDDKIHAGNWLRYVKENLPGVPIYWIPQSKKDRLYVDEKAVKGAMKIKNRSFLKHLNLNKVNCIYLSKSSAWVPPWLDSAYVIFQEELEKLFGKPIIYEPAPKKRIWDYEKLVENGIKERNAIEMLKNVEDCT